MGMSESSESSRDEAGSRLGLWRQRGGDPKDVKSVSHDRGGVIGDIEGVEGEEKAAPPMVARSTGQEKKNRLRNDQ